MGSAPVFGPAAHVWTVSQRHVLGEAINNIFLFFFSFFGFFVFWIFFLKTVRVRFLVYAIQKEGLPTLVCPWDRHPYLVLSPMCGPFLKDTFWGRRSITFFVVSRFWCFFFRFFCFWDFFSQNGSCQVFSLCDSKRGTPDPGPSMGSAPVFGPVTHVWTVSQRHILGEAIYNIFFFVFWFFVVFSLCDSKRGTPNPGLSMGSAPVFGPAAHVWTVS